jgi:hypothetical protein
MDYRICRFPRVFCCFVDFGKDYGVISHSSFRVLIDRVGNALLLVSLIVGGIMGALALVFVAATDWFEDAGDQDKAVAFMIGFVIGLAVCSILLSTVASGVNTVIVMVRGTEKYLAACQSMTLRNELTPSLPLSLLMHPPSCSRITLKYHKTCAAFGAKCIQVLCRISASVEGRVPSCSNICCRSIPNTISNDMKIIENDRFFSQSISHNHLHLR